MREVITTPTGEVIAVLTGKDAVAAALRVARECATRGGEVAAETVEILEGTL